MYGCGCSLKSHKQSFDSDCYERHVDHKEGYSRQIIGCVRRG
jgi:hypothetical protein